MGLFSFLRKNQQESSVGNSDFYSQAEEDKSAGRSKRRQGNKREEPVDPVLPEKKRARRRLVGAIALVLAAVIGLPMLLDSEPKPLADDINIQIPSKDTPAPLAPLAPSKPGAKAGPASVASTLGPDEEVVEPVTPAAATANTPKTDAKPAEPAKKPPVPAVKTEQAEQKAAVPTPTTRKSDDAARARAILDGKSGAATPAATPKTSGKVALQVAALASQDKVNELQKKLQGAGLKSYTQKVATASGERIRVRVGPFANAAEAEKARAKLSKIGLTGKLIPV